MRAPVGPPGRCPLPEPPPRSFRRRIRDPSGYHAAMGRQTARVRVAAPLRFLLPAQHRHGEVMVPVDAASSLSHLVESLGVPRTEVGELRVNGRTVLPAARPGDGDLVEVLPVPRPQRIDDPRFVLDVHLGTLARRMRLLGLDVAYRNDAEDAELVAQASRESRVVLTQERDVLDRFDPPLAPWTRCLACNGMLEPVAKQQVRHMLEDGTLRSYHRFFRCRACGRPYWRGAHAGRLNAIVANALRGREGG